MIRRVVIEELTPRDIEMMIQSAVERATQPLVEEISKLQEKLRVARPVIAHTEAPEYFDNRVTPETILRYIHEEGLTASKRGQTWFIRRDDLFEWQMAAGRRAA